MFQQGAEGRDGQQVPLHHIIDDNGELRAVEPGEGDVNAWGSTLR